MSMPRRTRVAVVAAVLLATVLLSACLALVDGMADERPDSDWLFASAVSQGVTRHF